MHSLVEGEVIAGGHIPDNSNLVAHPEGYIDPIFPFPLFNAFTVTVGIDPTSLHAAEMVTPVKNVIATWNGLMPTTGNIISGGANNIPPGLIDFESVLLHEMGHAIGLTHVNAASESGLVGADQDYTKATDGANNFFNLNDGADNVIGSADDVRGDDVPLNWYRTFNNNPFTIGATVDSSAYSRTLGSLPGGDFFPANPSRDVGTALGVLNTEATMQQGTFF